MALNLENAGYVNKGSVNWADLTGKIAESINQVGIDKQKQREDDERVFQETNSLLNKPLNLEKQSLTQFVLQSSDEYKKMALDLKKKLYNREITSSEYKQILANSQEYWQNFADQAKSADDRFKLYQERSTPDANGVIAASNAEDFLMEQYLNAADLNNKKMVIGKDGSMYLQAVDPNTGQAVGAPIDYRDFARPENMQINRVDVGEAVKNITSNWKSFQQWKDLGRGGEQTIESIKLQPGYKESKIQAVNAVVNNPKAALSVLVDNALPGGGIYYTSEADGQRMVDEAIATAKAQSKAIGAEWTKADEDAIRLSAVKFSKNAAGEWIPELTEEQMVKAKEAVDREIDMQMEYTISGSARQPYSSTGRNGDGDGSGSGTDLYPTLLDAWNNGKDGASTLTALTRGDFTFKWENGGLSIYKGEYNSDPVYSAFKPNQLISTVKSLKDIAVYMYPYTGAKGAVEANALFSQERERWKAKYGMDPSQYKKPKAGGNANNSGGNAR